MGWIKEKPLEHLALDQEDWSKTEWKTICKLFGVPNNDEELTMKVFMSEFQVFIGDKGKEKYYLTKLKKQGAQIVS